MRYFIALALIVAPLSLEAFHIHRTPYTAAEHLEAGKELIARGDRIVGCRHFKMIFTAYPDAPEVAEAYYQLGMLGVQEGDGRAAVKWFNRYLEKEPQTERFEEIFGYKLAIADAFCGGRRAHLFGGRWMPRWSGTKYDALELYDEIYAAMPSHEYGAQALYGKGLVLWKLREYDEAVDAMQGFIARFPRHEHAPDAYEAICNIYLDHVRYQPHNPDLLPLAQINLRKFRADFPTDERLLKGEEILEEIREALADALIETGKFYERKGIEPAACVYYTHAANDYVGTAAADFAIARLDELQPVNPLLEGPSLQDIAVADEPQEP